jgi:peptidoglycan/xylan/chitin deacetylase (PgdA/CDA1 family)
MLKVFITIDTEVWPLLPDWREDDLARDIDRDVYGRTSQGYFGLRYQIAMLNRFGLKGVFFVEPLFSEIAGEDALVAIVNQITDSGHEVQAHLHPEWLGWLGDSILSNSTDHEHLKEFTDKEQEQLIDKALHNLRDCGAEDVCAFRAGDYAANPATLRVLKNHGIPYDTSCNHGYGQRRALADGFPFMDQPFFINDICEVPISFFSDWPGHFRHAELCACSFNELRTVLLQAWRNGLYSFVLVSHTFELLKPRRSNPQNPRPDWTVVRRFEKLCQFLSSNSDKFCTSGFSGLLLNSIPTALRPPALRTGIHQTLWRVIEQSTRRFA